MSLQFPVISRDALKRVHGGAIPDFDAVAVAPGHHRKTLDIFFFTKEPCIADRSHRRLTVVAGRPDNVPPEPRYQDRACVPGIGKRAKDRVKVDRG